MKGTFEMTSSLKIGGVSALLGLAVLFWGCGGVPSGPEPVSQPQSVGEELFTENCASCHGMHGAGSPMLPPSVNFSTAEWQKLRSDEAIKTTIKTGKGMMPAFETTFTDAELAELVTYMRSLAPKPSH